VEPAVGAVDMGRVGGGGTGIKVGIKNEEVATGAGARGTLDVEGVDEGEGVMTEADKSSTNPEAAESEEVGVGVSGVGGVPKVGLP
jgi:hypothetical protein